METVLSGCLLGAAIAPGLPRESFNRGRWAFVSGHALDSSHRCPPPPAAPYVVLRPRATGSSCRSCLTSVASVPLRKLRREGAGARCQRLATEKIGSPLTPPLTILLCSWRMSNDPEQENEAEQDNPPTKNPAFGAC